MRKILSILNRKDLIKVLLVGVGLLAGGGFFYAVKADQIQYTYYSDADGDGYGVTSTTTLATEPPAGYARNGGDCADTVAAINPGAAEVCDNIDNDCDGYVDENVLITYYRDFDGDGYGLTSSTTQACSVPSGYATNQTDCNDSNADIKPGAAEACDNIDNDCDGSIDENCDLNTYYRDADNDTYGNPGQATTSYGSAPSGYVSNNNDCNDTKANIHPNAAEACDNIDNDCDGSIDENCASMKTYYRDADGDTYGNPSVSTTSLEAPSGYVNNDRDCNDTKGSIRPGVREICDGIDNNCDGTVDENMASRTYYFDNDADGFGGTATTSDCRLPLGYVTNNKDCNDSNRLIYPGAVEVKDNVDNDCDGKTDEDEAANASEICPYLGDNRLGTFVSCVNHYLNKLKAEGELENPEKARILKGLIQKIKEVIKTEKVEDKAEKKEIKKEIKDKKEEISGIRGGIKDSKEKFSGSFKKKGSCGE